MNQVINVPDYSHLSTEELKKEIMAKPDTLSPSNKPDGDKTKFYFRKLEHKDLVFIDGLLMNNNFDYWINTSTKTVDFNIPPAKNSFIYISCVNYFCYQDCKYLSPTEEAQHILGSRGNQHRCKRYSAPLFHGASHPCIVRLEFCKYRRRKRK